MRDIVGEVITNSQATFPYGPHHTDMQMLNDQLEPIYNSSVQTHDVV